MNVYDFDKTIYDGDSTADFYLFSLKKHKKIIFLFPSLAIGFIKFYVFKIGTKTQFKENMYSFLRYCNLSSDLDEFWKLNQYKIKSFYFDNQKEDDVIISASPYFLLKPICNKIMIKNLIASNVDPITYKYNGVNCHGKEKVKRFYEKYPNGKINEFYSDSYSDTPLAEISQTAYMVKKNKIIKWKFKKH